MAKLLPSITRYQVLTDLGQCLALLSGCFHWADYILYEIANTKSVSHIPELLSFCNRKREGACVVYGRGETGSEMVAEAGGSKTNTKGKEFQLRKAFFFLFYFLGLQRSIITHPRIHTHTASRFIYSWLSVAGMRKFLHWASVFLSVLYCYSSFSRLYFHSWLPTLTPFPSLGEWEGRQEGWNMNHLAHSLVMPQKKNWQA